MVEFDVPVFKKCCFCIPLRRGLLVWGYLKLVAALLVLWTLGLAAAMVEDGRGFLALTIVALICLGDLALVIVFLVGAHKKKEHLIRVFYKYCIFLLVISVILVTCTMLYQISAVESLGDEYPTLRMHIILETVKNMFVYLFNIVVQGYLLMLIRSELLKLKGTHSFEFVNNNADQCNMVVTIPPCAIPEKQGLH